MTNGNRNIVQIGILAGQANSSATLVSASTCGEISNSGGHIDTEFVSPTVVKVEVNTTYPFVGAQFAVDPSSLFYGVWEYPWDGHVTNYNVSFEIKGLGDSEGVNWSNARAPFFLNTANGGFGVYADTLAMGSFDFTTPGQSSFVFNSSSIVFYVVLPASANDYKSILSSYAKLSSTIAMPPDSGYGPIFYSDNFEQDFHGYVTNAQQNYYDVIDHLYYNEIHATALFADRPYGTGNGSWGNFDFDPVFYPSPRQFIQNLTAYGFDFQVWVSNRATPGTELSNVSIANGWQFGGVNYTTLQGGLQGPALNLSIPAAYAWFKDRLRTFTDLGVKGYKIDRGEEGEMPVWEQNIQMSLFEQLCAENMRETWGDDFYNFARSAVDRSRSNTAVWNGDSHSNFTGLAYTIASGIRAGLIGFSQWGADTGGYVRGANDPTEELWARWMWHATFSPMYEIMIGTNHTPWYSPYSNNLVQVLKQTANLHYDLFPYIKSYTWEAHTDGVPLMRSMLLEAPQDPQSWTMEDQYFFGEQLLVAPIVTSGGKRSLYLPSGTQWMEYLNKTAVYQGGQTLSVSLDVNAVPVYVKAGAIVPTGDIYEGNNKWTKDWQPYLDIEVFPSYKVSCSIFAYYNGKSGKEVQITLWTDSRAKTATLQYGDLGFAGSISFYTKSGVKNVTLTTGGGQAVIQNFESVFG